MAPGLTLAGVNSDTDSTCCADHTGLPATGHLAKRASGMINER